MVGIKKYRVKVTTGKARGAGTNATIKITLIDHEGNYSDEKILDKWLDKDFEYGKMDTYYMTTEEGFGRLERISLHRDKCGINDSWFVEHVTIIPEDERHVHFPLSRWLPPNQPMEFIKFDSDLPQVIKAKDPPCSLYEQRSKELDQKKIDFACEPLLKRVGMPRTVSILPPEETFHRDYLVDLGFTTISGLISDHLKKWRYADEFQSFNDMYKVYSGPLSPFPIPNGHADWRSDEKFARLRLTGPNCTVIRGVKKDGMPSSFPVDKSLLEKHFLEGQSFDACITKDKLFYINYKDLDGYEYTTNEKKNKMVAPIALFYVRFDGVLIPLAIQLYQKSSATNPIFYPPPIDEERVWLVAKFWFGVADSNYHEPVTHLLETHLVAGDFVTCFHQHISPSHPLYKLMLPHFIFLLNINTQGMPVLIAEDGAFNNILIFGLENCLSLMIKKYADFKLSDRWLETNMKNRGVENLPNYHFCEDGKLMFDAIYDYMTKAIKTIYGDDDTVAKDFELQNFAKMLCDPDVGMKGVWGNGSFTNLEDLTKTMTTMVFILTNMHAAANFNQYDEYSYPPNYPFRLDTLPPTDKTSLTESQVVKMFDVNTTLDTMELGRTLSLQGTNKIGHYETIYEFKPSILEHYAHFITVLKKVEVEIDARNLKRRHPYIWLSPRIVPNSISI